YRTFNRIYANGNDPDGPDLPFFIWHLMMVCDQHSHTQTLGIADLFCSADPMVTGNDGINPCLCRQIDKLPADPVTVFDPVRDIRIRQCPCSGKALQQYVCRTYPVNIIVPDDPD